MENIDIETDKKVERFNSYNFDKFSRSLRTFPVRIISLLEAYQFTILEMFRGNILIYLTVLSIEDFTEKIYPFGR